MFTSQSDARQAVNLLDGWRAIEESLPALSAQDRRRMLAVKDHIEEIWGPMPGLERFRVLSARERLRAYLSDGRSKATVRNMISSFNKIVEASPEVPTHPELLEEWRDDLSWQDGLTEPLINEWLEFVDLKGLARAENLNEAMLADFKDSLLKLGHDRFSTIPKKLKAISEALGIERSKVDVPQKVKDLLDLLLDSVGKAKPSDADSDFAIELDPFLVVSKEEALVRAAHVMKMFVLKLDLHLDESFPRNLFSGVTDKKAVEKFIGMRAKEDVSQETIFTNLHDLKAGYKLARLAGLPGFSTATGEEFEAYRKYLEALIKNISKRQKSKKKIFATNARREFHESCPDLMIEYPRLLESRGKFITEIMNRESLVRSTDSIATKTSLMNAQAEELRALCFLDLALSGGSRAEDLMEFHVSEIELYAGMYFVDLKPSKTFEATGFSQRFFVPPWFNSSFDLYLSKYRSHLNSESDYVFPPVGTSKAARKSNQYDYFCRWSKRVWGQELSNYQIRNGLILLSGETGSLYPVNVKTGHSPDWMSEKSLRGLTKLEARRYFHPHKQTLARQALTEYQEWARRLDIPYNWDALEKKVRRGELG